MSSSGTDADSGRWVEYLHADHPRHPQAVAQLRDVLLHVARAELNRRRGQLGAIAGPEFEDLADQAADDAVITILGKLDDFQGLSRFTTWAYKFAVFEVSSKVARHAWHHHAPSSDKLTTFELPDLHSPQAGDQVHRREQLRALAAAIDTLTERQREVFVAIALNDVSIDVLAVKLSTNRNAIYKNLFDARRRLKAGLADAGYAVDDREAAAR